MCWFSLTANVPTEQAFANQQLVVADLADIRGLVSPDKPEVFVCICEGTKLQISDMPEELIRQFETDGLAVAVFHVRKQARKRPSTTSTDVLWIDDDPRRAFYFKALLPGTQVTVIHVPQVAEEIGVQKLAA